MYNLGLQSALLLLHALNDLLQMLALLFQSCDLSSLLLPQAQNPLLTLFRQQHHLGTERLQLLDLLLQIHCNSILVIVGTST